MSPGLNGVRVKLDRAKVHLEAINTAVRKFVEVNLNNAQAFSDIDPFNRDWQVITWRDVPPVNPILGAVLGDFVHNVRSALDQLMWGMVLANEGTPGTHTQWPVSETENKWRDDVLERNIDERGCPPTQGLSDDALKLVQNFQPFQLGKRLRGSAPLMQLLRLSNEDKHRTLHVGRSFVTEGPYSLRFEPQGYLAFSKIQKPQRPVPIQDGTPFVRVKLRRIVWPPPKDIHMKMIFDVGVHTGFYAGEHYIAAADHVGPILKSAEDILAAALSSA